MNTKTIPIIKQTSTTELTINDVADGYQWIVNSRNQNFNKDLNLKGSYCHHPFNTITVDGSGDVFLCACQAWLPISVGKIWDFDSLDAILNTSVAIEIQKSILDGSYKYCDNHACSLLQSNLLESDLGKIESKIHWINLAFDHSCNLTCASCRSEFKFISEGAEFNLRKKISKHLVSLIESYYDTELKITLSSDGDPFASVIYRSFLEDLDLTGKNKTEIELITNGILLVDHWHKFYKIHKNIVNVKISFDAASDLTYKLVRAGGNWNKLLDSVRFLAQWRNENSSALTITSNFVVQHKNYHEIVDYIKLCKELRVDYINLQQIDNWGTFSNFDEQAVNKPTHVEYSQLLGIMQDPLLKDPQVNMTNLSHLINYLDSISCLSLHELVDFKNKIKNVSVIPIVDQLNRTRVELLHLFDSTSRLENFQGQFEQISTAISGCGDQIKLINKNVNLLVDKVEHEIEIASKKFLRRGYLVNGMFGSNKTDIATERSTRVSNLSSDVTDRVLTRIQTYSDWHYPTLEIGPGDGIWTKHLVAADPLYIIDIEQEYLDSTVNQFNEIYRKKIRTYLTGPHAGKSEFDYSDLPIGQFGFIFSWNVFDYFPYYETQQVLQQCSKLLRPGGTLMFSFNNCDTVNAVQFVEIGFKSWMNPALLAGLCSQHGLEIIHIEQLNDTVAWVEIKKPGSLTTVKAGPALGKISNLNA